MHFQQGTCSKPMVNTIANTFKRMYTGSFYRNSDDYFLACFGSGSHFLCFLDEARTAKWRMVSGTTVKIQTRNTLTSLANTVSQSLHDYRSCSHTDWFHSSICIPSTKSWSDFTIRSKKIIIIITMGSCLWLFLYRQLMVFTLFLEF